MSALDASGVDQCGHRDRPRRGGPARRRDRRVYLRSHPVLFPLLALLRRAPVLRLGRTVVVNDRQACADALTRVPLDRTAAGTTGGTANRLEIDGTLFDQAGTAHRQTRRRVADGLGAAGVARLRPVWTSLLDRELAPLADGGEVEMVALAALLAGATTAALLELETDPVRLARAARDAAAATAHEQLPGLPRPGAARSARRAAERLTALTAAGADGPLAAMLAVAAVNTTVAALPRAVAWCADDDLWSAAADARLRPALVTELLRVTAPSPLFPRVAAGSAELGRVRVRAGDKLILVARHAVDAHRRDPDATDPAPPHVSQLVFGAGSHACPGARLARAQLDDLLAALAPYRPVVVRARVDRRAALPGWATLTVRAGLR